MKGEKLGIIGAGNMGEALIRGIVGANLPIGRLIAGDKDKKRRDYLRRKYCISVTKDNLKVAGSASVVILAVKPQDMEAVLSEISFQLSAFSFQPLFISIAAGITTAYIEKFFKQEIPVIRVMPNAPALIGEGVSVVCLGKYAGAQDYRKAEDLFKTVGKVVRIEESLIDQVTAISGSGPAYFFLLIKYLTDIGVKLGLSKEMAQGLVNHTAQGAAKMIMETKQKPQTLIERVASKGGTTEAALEVFAKQNWEKTIEQAVRAAVKRAKELRH